MCQPVLILHVAARFTFFFCCGDVKSDATHIYGVIYRKHNRLLGNAESIGVGDWFMNSSVCEALAVSRMPPVNAIYGSLCSNIAYVYMYIDSLPSSSLYSCIVIGDLFAIPGGEYSLRKVLKLQITCKWHVGGNNDAEVTPEETRDELKGCLLPELAAWGAAECCRSTLLLLLAEKAAEWVFAHASFGAVCAYQSWQLQSISGASSVPRCIVSFGGQDHARSICVCSKRSARSFLLQADCTAVALCSLALRYVLQDAGRDVAVLPLHSAPRLQTQPGQSCAPSRGCVPTSATSTGLAGSTLVSFLPSSNGAPRGEAPSLLPWPGYMTS